MGSLKEMLHKLNHHYVQTNKAEAMVVDRKIIQRRRMCSKGQNCTLKQATIKTSDPEETMHLIRVLLRFFILSFTFPALGRCCGTKLPLYFFKRFVEAHLGVQILVSEEPLWHEPLFFFFFLRQILLSQKVLS